MDGYDFTNRGRGVTPVQRIIVGLVYTIIMIFGFLFLCGGTFAMVGGLGGANPGPWMMVWVFQTLLNVGFVAAPMVVSRRYGDRQYTTRVWLPLLLLGAVVWLANFAILSFSRQAFGS